MMDTSRLTIESVSDWESEVHGHHRTAATLRALAAERDNLAARLEEAEQQNHNWEREIDARNDAWEKCFDKERDRAKAADAKRDEANKVIAHAFAAITSARYEDAFVVLREAVNSIKETRDEI